MTGHVGRPAYGDLPVKYGFFVARPICEAKGEKACQRCPLISCCERDDEHCSDLESDYEIQGACVAEIEYMGRNLFFG